MKTLLSLPPNLVESFHDVTSLPHDEFFCTSDPVGQRLGSGGGTIWLLEECHRHEAPQSDFHEWLAQRPRLLMHAGGQSRRLPAYAPSGKILTPVPVFRWTRGQRLGQNLLELQLPLCQRIMEHAPKSLHTMVVSGDVLVRAGRLQEIPEADVICYGLWSDATVATRHGVYLSRRETPDRLDFMLQKPSMECLTTLAPTHLFLLDIGIWLLSDRAVERLMQKCRAADGTLQAYDLYADFGRALGDHPSQYDPLLADLSVAILPLPEGEFYHYGTSADIIRSTMAVQNRVHDQRAFTRLGVKPHPSLFVQNAQLAQPLTTANENVWIENCVLGSGWQLSDDHIITGVPENDWQLSLPRGVCLDVVPVGAQDYVLRPYGFYDAFRGSLADKETQYMGQPVAEWLAARHLTAQQIEGSEDMQTARLFPVVASMAEMGQMLHYMIDSPGHAEGEALWKRARKLSAEEISAQANLRRLCAQRVAMRAASWPALADNHRLSVFYQLNLADAAREFAACHIPEPAPLPDSEPLMKRISDQMFRSQLRRLQGRSGDEHEAQAFSLLRQGLTAQVLSHKQEPQMGVCPDQIVWGRSPVRIDVAGGWTDTPPYCLTNGGNVVNLAVELNGQPPLQAYVKPCREPKIILRSIDLGAMEEVTTYEQLSDFMRINSPFSIPKAALCLAGFAPQFSMRSYASLEAQLKSFGCGIELTLFSAVPAGSGLGTSSILAATVLGALSNFCALGWDQTEIGHRTLVLEQMLTTGGGWQDQYGGILPGIKLLQTVPGFDQKPRTRWLPDALFTKPEWRDCHLLYYTGITRTAKHILAEIVRGMFLGETSHLALLDAMKQHALDLYEAITQNQFEVYGTLVRKTWQQNQALDTGTNPPAIEALTRLVDDLCLGYKLPGAGGGGFLYMVARDPEAAARIRRILTEHRPNDNARFVEMTLSHTGLQVSRS